MDVNILINIMLGIAAADDYGDSDLSGNGMVDIGDINLVINLMLGK